MNYILKTKILTVFLLVTMLVNIFSFSSTVKAVENNTQNNSNTEINNDTDCEDCDDNKTTCQTCETADECIYSVVSPVGYGTIEMITQAKRLDTLEGKKIALIGGSFNASTTYSEIKKCILEEYPTAVVYVLSEVGSGGVYSPQKPSNQTINFQNKLKELEIDAVVSGNCGCGLCTVKETGSSIAAEYIGIPTVTVGAPSFIAEIKTTGINRGVSVLRTAEYPGAFSSATKEELQKNAREVLYPQIKEGLTTPISNEEIQNGQPKEAPYNEIVYSGCFDCVQEYFSMNEWTDGNPIVPPTNEKIKEYLKYTTYVSDRGNVNEDATIVPSIAPSNRKATLYAVAANAVMAGCPEEYMPLCIAFTKCLADENFRQTLSSTHAWTPYAWINGPLARQLGIDSKQMNSEKNKAFARFIELAMLNLAGYYIKDNRMGTFGYLTPFAFSEDEEKCLEIGWEPYHVALGMDINQNALTAASALQWGNSTKISTNNADEIKDLIAFDITEKGQNGLGTTKPQVFRTIFLTENVAKNLSTKYSKDSLENALIDTARRPLWFRAYANYWGNTGSNQSFSRRTLEDQYNKLKEDEEEQAKETVLPTWLQKLLPDNKIWTIATMNKSNITTNEVQHLYSTITGTETAILITGNSNENKAQVMPGGAYSTIEIELPKNWDELMTAKGYEPLSSFYIGNQKEKSVETTLEDDCDECDDIPVCDDCENTTQNCIYDVVSPVENSNETIYSGCSDCVQEYFEEKGWTGGTTIVPPTDEKVQEYLSYTPYKSNEILGTIASNKKQYSTYMVAVNAAMAGCPEEYMPLCIAFTKCLEDEEWIKSLSETDGWTPYAWINGPIARQLGIDHEQGMISEEKNKTLARFIELAMINIAGYTDRTDTFGYLSPFAFSEDEETCYEIGWEPYHVSQGMNINSNAITTSAILQWGNSVTPATTDADEIMKIMAFDITEKQESGLGTGKAQVNRTIFITKATAEDLVTKYSSKNLLEDDLIKTARRPLWLRAFASYYGTGSSATSLQEHYEQLLQTSSEKAEMTETPAWFKNLLPDQDEIMTVATMNKGETKIILTGDESRNKIQTMPGAGYKTVQIELPNNWNELMEAKGYEALSSFYLEPSSDIENQNPGDTDNDNEETQNPEDTDNDNEENTNPENTDNDNEENTNTGDADNNNEENQNPGNTDNEEKTNTGSTDNNNGNQNLGNIDNDNEGNGNSGNTSNNKDQNQNTNNKQEKNNYSTQTQNKYSNTSNSIIPKTGENNYFIVCTLGILIILAVYSFIRMKTIKK